MKPKIDILIYQDFAYVVMVIMRIWIKVVLNVILVARNVKL